LQRHSGARAQHANPASILAGRGYGFRVRRFAAPGTTWTNRRSDAVIVVALLKPILLVFWRSSSGREPVREWLNELPREDQRTIGKVQFGWPVGLPLCRPLSHGLWEVRSSLASKREARVLFGFHDGTLVALHGFVKKTQKTSPEDLD
jgi:phage-related protein